MTTSALRRYRAERLLRKDFPELRAKVLAVVRSQLSAKGITLDYDDLEGCYSQAFQGLYATVLGGEEIENPTGWLVTVTFRRAIDEGRAAARRGRSAGAQPATGWVGAADDDRWAAPHEDIAGVLDDRTKLRQVFEGLHASLTPRECEAASLCYLQGLTRAEAAQRMGIREARIHKLMDGAPGRLGVAGKVGELLSTIKTGGWCEQQSSLMRAYAFGILDPEGERHGWAVAHLRECPACRAHVASLRGLAAVLPPLPLTLALAGGSGSAAGTTVTGGGASTTSGAGSAAGTGGWLGGMGSLAAKLAVMGLVATATGFALHRSGDHGRSGGAASVVSGSSALARNSQSRFSLVTPLVEAHRKSTIETSSTPRPRRKGVVRHAAAGQGVPARSIAASPEFSPERVRPAAHTSPPAPSPSAGSEFGF
jgi:DNA-directed RNA polymerase specialized sigma24 family protein